MTTRNLLRGAQNSSPPPPLRVLVNALPLLLSLLLSAPPAPSARTLNTEGFRLYQAGQYTEALEKFRAATRANPKMALAHYNVAATLGVLRQKGKICEAEAYRETILEYLKRSVELDKRRLARAREDSDLDVIRDTVGWQLLLGRSLKKTSDLPEILQKVTWSIIPAGVMSPRLTLTFSASGRVVLKTAEVDTTSEKGGLLRREEQGTYTLTGRAVRLTFPKRQPVQGTLTERGALELGTLGTFVDSPPECDA